MDILYNSTFVVGVSLALFLALLGYLGVHKIIFKWLDNRAADIRAQLDEAKKLREDAQETFADFERKQKSVDDQAKEIIEHAKTEAEAAAERAKAETARSVERGRKAADEQIARAEADAIKEGRDRAVSVAIAAAGEVLAQQLSEDRARQLVDDAIGAVGAKLH